MHLDSSMMIKPTKQKMKERKEEEEEEEAVE